MKMTLIIKRMELIISFHFLCIIIIHGMKVINNSEKEHCKLFSMFAISSNHFSVISFSNLKEFEMGIKPYGAKLTNNPGSVIFTPGTVAIPIIPSKWDFSHEIDNNQAIALFFLSGILIRRKDLFLESDFIIKLEEKKDSRIIISSSLSENKSSGLIK